MAQLAVAGGGAAIGAVVGTFLIPGLGTMAGAQIGWALGGVAGALLFPPKGPNTEGPRLGDAGQQTSGYGLPIPVVAGRTKIAGNIIWATEREERKKTKKQGKGGQQATATEYTYFRSFAVGLCEWLTPAVNPNVLKIWLDTSLVYDTTGASEIVQLPGLVWRFYPGSDTQLPDPLIEAAVGAADAPAHRDCCYIVFENMPLDRFGGRIPQVTVELAAEVTRSFPQISAIPPAEPLWDSQFSNRVYNFGAAMTSNIAVDYARGRIYEGRRRTTGAVGTPADEMIRVYDLISMETIGEYQYDRVCAPLTGGTGSLNGLGCGLLHLGVDGFLYVVGGNSTHTPVIKVNPDRMIAVDFFGTSINGGGFSFASSNGNYLTVPIQMTSFQTPRLGATPRTFLAAVGNYGGCIIIDADHMEYVWGDTGISEEPEPFTGVGALYNVAQVRKLVPGAIRENGTDLWVLESTGPAFGSTITVSKIRVTSGALDLTAGASMGVFRSDYADISMPAEVDAGASSAWLQNAFYDQSDDTLIITCAGFRNFTGVSRVSTFKWIPGGGVDWAVVNHFSEAFDDTRGDAGRLLSSLWARGGNLVLQAGTGDTLVNQDGAAWRQTVAWIDEQQAIVGWIDQTTRQLAKRYMTRAAPNTLTEADIVDALCLRAGLEITQFDTSALTNTVRGYLLARPMSARDAITPLAASGGFDAVEQDDVIVFRRRGGAPVVHIPYTDFVRNNMDEPAVKPLRAQDSELPREVVVRFPDIDRGWEQNAQTWRRPRSPTPVVYSDSIATIDIPIPLTVDEAATVARRQCIGLWRERTRVTGQLPQKYARLVPTDPVTMEMKDGRTIRVRFLTTDFGADYTVEFEAVIEDASVNDLVGVGDGGSGWEEPEMPLPYYVMLELPDLALIDDAHDLGQSALREYAFACPYNEAQFKGVRVVRSPDGSSWLDLDVIMDPAVWGTVIATPDLPWTPWTWDREGQIKVRLTAGELDSVTELEALNGANMAALIGSDGSAEIFTFATATLEDDGTYTLTDLIRGQRGTEDLIATRAIGNGFVLFDGADLQFSDATTSQAATRFYRALTVFESILTARTTVTKSVRGRAEKPYAPAHVRGTRDGGLNLTGTFTRRTRVGGAWADGTATVPVSEASQAYEVDVMNGGSVVRTISGLSTPTFSYSAANQTTDFGSPQASITVRVYQISNIVGRGIAAEATI